MPSVLSSPFRLKITKVRAWRAGAFVREGPVFLLSAHQFFGGKECAQGLKKGPGARGARVTDLSWANLEALLSSCHLQSQGIKGGGAGRDVRWEGGSLRKDSKFRQGVGAAGYKGDGSPGQTDTPLNQVRGSLGDSVASPWSPSLEGFCLLGSGVQVGLRPKGSARTALLQPWEVPTDRGGGSQGKARNLFSPPICLSFPASAAPHFLYPPCCLHPPPSLEAFLLFVWFYSVSWSLSILVTLVPLCLSPLPFLPGRCSNLLTSLYFQFRPPLPPGAFTNSASFPY